MANMNIDDCDFVFDFDVEYGNNLSNNKYIDYMESDVKETYNQIRQDFLSIAKSLNSIIQKEGYNYNLSILTHLDNLVCFYKREPYRNIHKYKRKLIIRALAIDYIDSNFLITLIKLLENMKEDKSMSKEEKNGNNSMYSRIFNILTRFAHLSNEFSKTLVVISDFIDFLLDQLEKYSLIITDSKKAKKIKLQKEVSSTMSLIYNIIRYDDCKSYFIDNTRFVDSIKSLLCMNVTSIQLMSIFSLAYVAREDKAELFHSNASIILYAVESLEKAISSRKTKCDDEWTAYELAKGIGRLAVNDSNKQLLVENGAVIPLYKLTLSEDDEEAYEACEALLNLAFDEEIKRDINQVKGLKENIKKLSKTDRPCHKPAQGLLWVLNQEYRDERNQNNQDTLRATRPMLKSIERGGECNNRSHIMISYEWSHQKIVLQIKDFLVRHGFKIWIDLINMQGSTLDAVACGIEQSSLVLLCYSENYKISPFCRMEAEYVVTKKKKFLPVRMDKSYKPDGWLGIIIGSRLYYDFSEINTPGHLKKFLKDINDICKKKTLKAYMKFILSIFSLIFISLYFRLFCFSFYLSFFLFLLSSSLSFSFCIIYNLIFSCYFLYSKSGS
ncbi:DgyrCDS8740 [Dimorphilus gyrociliatus]|uniref:DgyrCDS8740 n=1 Tax=Dimorphilus gyrociliatus TaxID=2664684 RepID=A0A7I8VV50_9ANNE|nr:DgyrCDS8740 [Dimorphilus gyrociliatus]